jgi:hypothetical protein
MNLASFKSPSLEHCIKNLSLLDFSLLLPDVMTIADEVDSQLTQTMESFSNPVPKSAKAQLVKPKG